MILENLDTAKETFIVAEIGNNHEGSIDLAHEMLTKAAEAGANAVKFQTFKAELFVSSIDQARLKTLKEFQLSFEQFEFLSNEARKLGVLFFSTPLDLVSANFLDGIQNIYKIASGDNNYYQLIDTVLEKNKPVIISTGATDMHLIKKILERVSDKIGIEEITKRIAILHCVSSYPVEEGQENISAISSLKNTFPGVTIGYSDHCLGIERAVYSVAAGAEIVEKHFTIDNNYSEFRDHALSADPDTFREMVERIRAVEEMLGTGEKVIQPCESENSVLIRRSLAAARDIPANKPLKAEDIVCLRPGDGISAADIDLYHGRKASRAIKKSDFLSQEDFITED